MVPQEDGEDLISAAKESNCRRLSELLDGGICDPLAADSRGYTAAHWAASCDHLDALLLLLSRHPELCSASTDRGNTILHIAAMNNSKRVVKELVLKKTNMTDVDINARNCWGETPLHVASAVGSAELVAMLLDCSVDYNIRDKWNRTAKQVAMEYGASAIVELLLNYGDQSTCEKDGCEEMDLLTSVASDIRKRIHLELASRNSSKLVATGTTIKHIFKDTTKGSPSKSFSEKKFVAESNEMVKKKSISQQLEYPGDFDLLTAMLSQPDIYDRTGKDMFGLAAIHKLSVWNKPDFLNVFCDGATAEELNLSGGDLGFTCLHYCVEMNAMQSLMFFVNNLNDKLNFKAEDIRGRTALDLARETKKVAFVDMLEPVTNDV